MVSAILTEATPLLLASGSPRRREILKNLRIPFAVVAPTGVDESVLSGEGAEEYLARVVLAKLHAAADVFRVPLGDTLRDASVVAAAAAVLVADTSVICDDEILGKPETREHAEAMLARLAGRTHEVRTRFVLAASTPETDVLHAETVVTRVTFRPLSAEAVRRYVESGEGEDKAGGYAVQGLGAALVSRIEGSFTNVVGLPACELVVALERLGLSR